MNGDIFMDNTAAAYIAGIMDGEGCFYIERFATKKAKSKVRFQYRVMATVTMCDEDTIDFICAMTNKKYRKRKIKSGRIAYTIDWRNGIAARFIETILPYLIGKREQAEWCLVFDEQLTPGRGKPYTEIMAVQCEIIRKKLQDLKKMPFAAD